MVTDKPEQPANEKPPPYVMRKITRIVVKQFWGLFAFLLCSFAVLVVIGRLATPLVANYRDELADLASARLGLTVEVAALQATWEGLSPELLLEDIQVSGANGETVVRIASAVAKLDLLRSIFRLDWKWRTLEFSDSYVPFQQDDDGMWRLVAVDPQAGQAFTLDDFLLLSNQVALSNARFDFNFRTGQSTTVTFPNLLVESNGGFRRYSTQIDVDQQSDVLTFVVETRGDMRDQEDFSAKGYLKLHDFDLDKAVAALPGDFWEALPNQEWRQGHDLNVEMWFDIFTGNQVLARGNISVGEIPLTLAEGFTAPQGMAADFIFQWRNKGGWSLSLVNADVRWRDVSSPTFNAVASSPDLGGPVTVQVPELDLAAWQQTLTQARFFPERATDILDALAPRGAVRNIAITINGTGVDDIEIKANLDDVSNTPWSGVPGLTHVNGYIQSTLRRGFIEVDSRNGFSMLYQKIYDEPMVFDNASGQVNWFIDYPQRRLTLYSGLLRASGDAGQGQGYFILRTPTYADSGIATELQLQVGVYNSRVEYHKIFVPVVAPQSLRDWLDASVKSGRVPSAGFLYRGGVNHDTARQASIQLFAEVTDAELQFDPQWPELKTASGTLWIDNRRLNGDLSGGRLLDSRLEQATVDVAPLQSDTEFLLTIDGRSSGSAADGLRLLRETPLRNIAGDYLNGWRIDGRLQTEFNLSIPLSEANLGLAGKTIVERTRVESTAVENKTVPNTPIQNIVKSTIKATLKDADLAIPDYDLNLGGLSGSIYYDAARGLHADKLNGKFLERPVTLSIATLAEHHNEQQAQSTGPDGVSFNKILVAMRGDVAVDVLTQWLRRPELAFMEGQGAYQAELSIPFAKARRDTYRNDTYLNESIQIAVQSDLQGIAVNLPAPFAKPFDSSAPFLLRAAVGSDQNQVEIRYGDTVTGLFQTRAGRLVNAGIGLNTEAVYGDASQLYVRGRLDNVAWRDWVDVFDRYQGYRNAIDGRDLTPPDRLLPIAFELDMKQFQYNDTVVDELVVAGKQSPNFWRFSVSAPLLAGDITWFENAATPAVVDLQYLRLPETERDARDGDELAGSASRADPLADWDPASLPPLDFTTREFSVGADNYGSWSFQLRPIAAGALFSHLVSDVRGGRIGGNSESEGAILRWTKTDAQDRSHFEGRFAATNLADVFQQWDQPQMLESERATMEANVDWQGSPAMVALEALRGDLSFTVTKGRFRREEASGGEGILRLLGLLNFDTWARRMRLDFSDLYGKGLAFDTINGNMTFDEGKLYFTQPIIVTTPSSRLQMAGTIDIKRENIDGTLVATLPVGGNLTLVSFFAGGLPAALGVYLVSKLFKEQVDKVASVSYRIQGSLDEFDIEFERLFDSKAAEKAGDKSRQSMEANSDGEQPEQ